MSCDKLMKRVGEMGPFQILYLAVMGLTEIVCGVHVLMPIFAAHRRPYWCASWGNISTVEYQCNARNTSSLSLDKLDVNTTCPDEDWEFDTSIIQSTIQSQFQLVCKLEFLVPLSTSLFMGGFLIGASLYGFLSDRYGRAKISSVVALHALLISIATSFAPSLLLYILGRLLLGISVGGILTIANSTSVEILTHKWRLTGMTVASFGWIVGSFLLLLIAYFQRSHTYLQLISSVSAVPGLFCFLILPEPLRWLIVNDHIETAYKVAVKMARMNKKPPLSREEFDQFIISTKDDKTEIKKSKSCLSTWTKFKDQFSFLRHRNLRRITFSMWFLFWSTSFIIYSYRFSIGKFDDDIYRNVLIMLVISVAQYIPVYAMGHWLGRIKMLISTYACSAIFTFALIGLYKVENYEHYAVWIALAAKFFLHVAFFLIWLLGTELYPTEIRGSAVGSCSTVARIGAMLSPQVIHLDLIWRPLPFIIYGCIGLLTCIVAIFLPETKGLPTLETVMEGESFAKHNRLWRERWLPERDEANKEQLLEIGISENGRNEECDNNKIVS